MEKASSQGKLTTTPLPFTRPHATFELREHLKTAEDERKTPRMTKGSIGELLTWPRTQSRRTPRWQLCLTVLFHSLQHFASNYTLATVGRIFQLLDCGLHYLEIIQISKPERLRLQMMSKYLVIEENKFFVSHKYEDTVLMNKCLKMVSVGEDDTAEFTWNGARNTKRFTPASLRSIKL